MARKASSGLAKFEAIDSGMTQTSIQTGGTRQRRVYCRPRRLAETRGDITIRPEQIGGASLRVVTPGGETLRVVEAVLDANTDRSDAVRGVGSHAIAKLQQGEPRVLRDE